MSNLFFLIILILTFNISAKELMVYSARNEQLIKPLFEAYTKETGIQIKYHTDKEGPLLQKIKTEGTETAADIFMTVDAGNLWLAAKENVLQSVDSKVLDKNIPANLKDPTNQWFGLSVRARTIFYNPEKVNPSELSTYEDLSLSKFKGRLCLRTSNKVYNQSLVAMMIVEHGEKKAEEIVKGWVNNLKTEVFSDDTKLLEAIHAGICDIGIANTYYFGRLQEKTPDLKVALFWPNQKTNGVHVNISGAGITKYSKNKEEAIKLLEWLSSKKAQNLYADSNLEYPANKNIKADPKVAAWGKFKSNHINVAKAGELQSAAVKLMDRVQYK